MTLQKKAGSIFIMGIGLCLFFLSGFATTHTDHVTIAILAKDKAHTLPMYLSCIENQTWPTKQTYLYIRTNNNNDNTTDILRQWIKKVQHRYAAIYFDDTDVAEPVQNYKQHEWNSVRFKVLGKIRQDSITWAREHKSHYFVADCDNFIKPHTLENLMQTNLPIVAPLLHTGSGAYSNYHAAVSDNGYYADSDLYYQLFNRKVKGLIQVPLVHCTYLVRYEALDKVCYNDHSHRYNYVIFSNSARKQAIPQYLDTREVYGRISFAENTTGLHAEPWIKEFPDKPRVSIITSVFKGDKFIQGFLEDIVQQTIFNECELILINANSPDNEESIIKPYLAKYPNIKYFLLNKDPGLYAVWNMAIKLAAADFITNANLDDRRNPQSLEIQTQALEKNSDVDLVYGDYLITKIPHETFKKSIYHMVAQMPEFQPHRMNLCIPGPQPMWRKSMHEKYGLFNEDFSYLGDWEMWNRAVSKGACFKKIPNFLTGLFYENPEGLSTDKNPLKEMGRKIETAYIIQTYSHVWNWNKHAQ